MLDELILLRQVVLHISIAEELVLARDQCIDYRSLINIQHQLIATGSTSARDGL